MKLLTNLFILTLFHGIRAWAPPPMIQNIISSIASSPIANNVQNAFDQIKHLPIEERINFMYFSYNIRNLFYTIALSKENIFKVFHDLELTEIDYFNTIVFIVAIYTFIKDRKIEKNVNKFVERGYISNNNIHTMRICFLVFYSILFRDIDYVF